MKTALVTGACGFVGSHMVEELLQKGDYKVRATDLETASKKYLEGLDVEFISGNLTNKEDMKKVCSGVDVIFNVASFFDFAGPWEKLYKVNVEGMRNICEEAVEAKVKRFIHWSTGGVYGPPIKEHLPVTEKHPLGAFNNYEKAKLMQEQVGMEFYQKYSLPITIIRPGGVIYGPRNIYGGWDIFKLLKIFKIGFSISSIKNRVAFVHVKDIVGAAVFLSENDSAIGQPYNVGDDTAYTQEEFTQYICSLLGIKCLRIYVPLGVLKIVVKTLHKITSLIEKRIYPKKLLVDSDTILYVLNDYYFVSNKLKQLGYKLRYPDVKEGIKEVVSWYKKEGML